MATHDVDLSGVKAAEIPRYRLTEPAFINDVLYEKGAEIDYPHVPGWYMDPLNKAAKAMIDKHHPQPYNVVDELTKIGGGSRGP